MENYENPDMPQPNHMDSFTYCFIGRGRKLITIALIALVLLVGVLEAKRRTVEQQLEQLTVRLEQLQTGNTQQNREQAQRILRKVKRLMVISDEIEPTVAQIVDVEELRKRNPFYGRANNGNYLIVTVDRAILYDDAKNVILDVVPVQIQAAPASTEEAPAE